MSSTKHEMDMAYIKGNIKIDLAERDMLAVLEQLRDEHKLNTTSWVLNALAEEWDVSVEHVRNSYRELLVEANTCAHGFFVDEDNECHYCTWGTE